MDPTKSTKAMANIHYSRAQIVANVKRPSSRYQKTSSTPEDSLVVSNLVRRTVTTRASQQSKKDRTNINIYRGFIDLIKL